MFIILSIVKVDNRTEFHFVLIRSIKLFFEFGNADLELGGLLGRFFLSVSMLFDIQISGLAATCSVNCSSDSGRNGGIGCKAAIPKVGAT